MKQHQKLKHFEKKLGCDAVTDCLLLPQDNPTKAMYFSLKLHNMYRSATISDSKRTLSGKMFIQLNTHRPSCQ